MTSQGAGVSSAIYVCDHCRIRLIIPVTALLPAPWRAFHVPGWVGRFHACKDECETLVREETREEDFDPHATD